MSRKNIAILRGGPSSEYDFSLRTGRAVIEALRGKHLIKDIVIDKNGDWYCGGFNLKPQKALERTDVVFNAMHGDYGEDGKVQQILENLNIPFTGSGAFGSAMSINKVRAKKVFDQYDIQTPFAKVVSNTASTEEIAFAIFRSFPMPVILKPISKGSSVDVIVVKDFHSLVASLDFLFEKYDQILMEEFIQGKEATVGVLENFRDQSAYASMPLQISVPGDYFDYECKNSTENDNICDCTLSQKEKETLQELAIKAHQGLNLRHYSRSDFIIHPRRGIFLLETNSLPDFTPQGLYAKGFEQTGASYENLLDHLIEMAHNNK